MKGSVRRLPSGKWMLIYDAPRSPDGKRKQKYETVVAKTKAKAEVAAIASGDYATPSEMTLGALLDRYFEARAGRIEGTTLALYKRTLDQHVRPIIGNVRVGELKREHIERVLREGRDRSTRKRRGEPLGPRTLRNILIRTRSVLKWGSRNYEGIRNVALDVEPPKADDREIIPFDGDRVRSLLLAVAGTELEAVVTTAIGTGLRRGELCALRWCDVDLEEGQLHVRRSVALLDHKIIIKAPKTKGSRRTVAVPAFVIAALRAHRKRQAERHLSIGIGNRGTEGVVFDRYDGVRWNPNELSRQFSRLTRRKKLPPLRFHDLRHGYASLAFASGAPLKIVSELLGHSRIGITGDLYTHVLDSQKQETAKSLDAYLDSAVRPQRSA